jgi:hypothetical protein
MSLLRAVSTLSAVLLLASCGGAKKESLTFDKVVDELGKKIVADWQAVPGVAAARYEYTHGLDLGQGIGLDAALKPEVASDALVQELVEIVKRDYWQSTASAVIGAAMYRSEKIPDGPPADKSIIMYNGPIKINLDDQAQVDELTKKYGPRPEKK